MQFIYILSDYDEYGAQNVVATLDRAHLPALVEENWAEATAAWRDKAKASVAALLAKPDEELSSPDGHKCHDGWGGVMLHVVPLRPR